MPRFRHVAPPKPACYATHNLAWVRSRSPSSCLKFRARLCRDFDQGSDPRVTDRTSSVSGVAERYASAFFDLARDESAIDDIETDLGTIEGMLDASPDFRRLIESPVFSAEDQERAIAAIVEKAGFGALTRNFVRLVAKNRRLFALPGIVKAFHEMAARHRGEMTAEVTSAHVLDDSQIAALKSALKDKLGKDVTLQARVNPALLGGLVVKVGSRMIDTSLRTRLMTVKTQLKEVG
jgi:F-type H+-transporting ATPase subunit delta